MTAVDVNISPDHRIGPPALPRLLGPDPTLATHLARYGPLTRQSSMLIDAVRAAGLTGRGGARFPTADKLAAVLHAPSPRVVVGNGTEGEPLSAKDKTLLVRSPHLVLDGLEIAARIVGARHRILCVERGNPAVHAALATALAERGDRHTDVVFTPRRYITGQETALVDFINRGPGRPTGERPYERGVDRRPTLVDNVETLAHLALIARFGPSWFRSVGTPMSPGSLLVTVAGAVQDPGVFELPGGASLDGLLHGVGARRPRAVLLGGYYGQWISAEAAAVTALSAEGTRDHGTSLGCGVVAVVDHDSCAVAEFTRVIRWFAASSAGQCGACAWGLRDIVSATEALQAGRSVPEAASDIARWASRIRGRGACRLPDGAIDFLESGLRVFAPEIDEHRRGRCTRPDRRLLSTPRPEPWA